MERLKRVLDNILDDKLILKVYKIREKGRNEYLVVKRSKKKLTVKNDVWLYLCHQHTVFLEEFKNTEKR